MKPNSSLWVFGNVLKQFFEGFWKYPQSSSLRVCGINLNRLFFESD
jgi:hypothetical protein